MYSAVDSSGFLTCDVPAYDYSSDDAPTRLATDGDFPGLLDVLTRAVTKYGYTRSDGGRFYLYHPLPAHPNVAVFAAALEQAWDICADMGFALGYVLRGTTPMDSVCVLMNADEPKAMFFMGMQYVRPRVGEGSYGRLRVNYGTVNNATNRELQRLAGRLMMFLGGNCYVRTGYHFQDFWFFHAMVAWAEEKFVSGETAPSTFPGQEVVPLTGLARICLSSGLNLEGFAAVLEYIERTYGRDAIVQIAQRFATTQEDMTVAVDNTIADPYYQWYPEFVRAYCTGSVYNVAAGTLLNAKAGEWVMSNPDADSVRLLTGQHLGLSANLFRIDLPATGLTQQSVLTVRIESADIAYPYVVIQPYRYHNGSLEFLGDGDSLTVADVATIAAAGDDLVAAVVYCNMSPFDPFCTKSDVVVEAKVTTGADLVYNWCRIDVAHMSFYVQKSDGEYEWKTDQSYSWEGQGSFVGNTFTAVYDGPDPYDPDIQRVGSVSVTLDPLSLDVVSFSGQQTLTRYSGTIQTVAGISGGTVSFNETTTVPNPYLSCVEYGNDACATITSLPYRYDWIPAEYWEEKQSHSCTSESSIRITFWQWYGN